MKRSDSDTQVLTSAAGDIIPSRFSHYSEMDGASSGFQPPHPSRLRTFWVGAVGEGKSTFCASIPNTLIFDFENKYTSIPIRAKGTVPVYLKTGREYADLITDLIADQENGTPAFRTIAFDPINIFVLMMRNLITEQLIDEGKLDGADVGVDVTQYGRGGKGWDMVNSSVIGCLFRLYNAGYGHAVFAHKMPKWVKDSSGEETVQWDHVLNPGVYRTLYAECEFSGSIECEVESVEVPTGKKRKLGKAVIDCTRTELRRRYQLNFDAHEEKSLPTRVHVPMPDKPIPIPEGRGWKAFVKYYRRGVEKKLKMISRREGTK